MRPTQIKRNNAANSLVLTWDDGHVSEIPIQFLRDECPCAGCKGETILGTHYPPPLKLFHDGMYILESLTPVGQYAIQAVWKDGHDTGLYSWEYLRMIEDELKQTQK